QQPLLDELLDGSLRGLLADVQVGGDVEVRQGHERGVALQPLPLADVAVDDGGGPVTLQHLDEQQRYVQEGGGVVELAGHRVVRVCGVHVSTSIGAEGMRSERRARSWSRVTRPASIDVNRGTLPPVAFGAADADRLPVDAADVNELEAAIGAGI